MYKLLNPKGRYLSVYFGEKDPQFGGSGKYRQTSLGTVLYFSSEEEFRELFKANFKIEEFRLLAAGKM